MLIRKHTLFDSVFGLLVDGPQPAGHARRQADGCGPPPGEAAARAAPRAAKKRQTDIITDKQYNSYRPPETQRTEKRLRPADRAAGHCWILTSCSR